MRFEQLLTVFFIIVISGKIGFAQYSTDIGIGIGASNYLGEIGGNELPRRDFVWDVKLEQTRLAYSMFYRKKFNNDWAIKANILYTRLKGNDALSSNPGRRARNLSFRTDLLEISGTAQFYLYEKYDVGGHGRYLVEFRPYLFAGVGLTYFSPAAELNGEWIRLRQLKTEGQSKPYSPVTLSIPAGGGLYLNFHKRYRISWELGYRITLTDYLDDISGNYADLNGLSAQLGNRYNELPPDQQSNLPSAKNYQPGEKRGDAKNKDGFIYTDLGFSYVLRDRNPYTNSYRSVQRNSGPLRRLKSRMIHWRHKF